MRIVIVGSRTYTSLDQVYAFVRELPAGTVVIGGGALGADATSDAEAHRCWLAVVSLRPDYATHGRRAPLIRNGAMMAQCDRLVAFWDGVSTGTAHAISSVSRRAGRPVVIR